MLVIFLAASFVIAAYPCNAMQLYLPFDEIVKQADVIFLGKALEQQTRAGANDKMIFTDVSFKVERIIFSREGLQGKVKDDILLTFAGGKMGEKIIKVSDVPFFDTGSTYLIFTLLDGKTYASPIVGSYQGLFQVLTDEIIGISYPLTSGKRPIVGIENQDILVGPPISQIKGGILEKAAETEEVRWKYYDVAPQAVEGEQAKASVKQLSKEMPQKIMNIDEFIGEINKRIQGNK